MARKTRQYKACTANLQKAREQMLPEALWHPEPPSAGSPRGGTLGTSDRPTEEADVDMPSLEPWKDGMDSDSDIESEMKEEEEVSYPEDYAEFLRIAQATLAERERAWMAEYHRPKHYTGNLDRSERRHKANRNRLAVEGANFISDYFQPVSRGHYDTNASETELPDSGDGVGIYDRALSSENTPKSPVLLSITSLPVLPLPSELVSPPPVLPSPGFQVVAGPTTSEQHRKLQELLKASETDISGFSESQANWELNQYSYLQFPMLHQAQKQLTVKIKDKTLNVVYRTRITAMVATLNFYLDHDLCYSWRRASVLASKASSRSEKYARTIRSWIHQYLRSRQLPLHGYGHGRSSILDDKDFAAHWQTYLMKISKERCIFAKDIVSYITTPEMQDRLPTKLTITERTARRWLHKMDWWYSEKKNGMYIDGHE
ncbi:hypothetical protein PHLCEN_2v4066 [Hermanssonia centrifuga]|uniref:Uncharacterized protein n=1 Tax=Hermanssonia centrifuga TaxID=98765 RepID=A0A2R6Q5E7_9APHY|nr:hypothetical protein PHLCEN_2v4066 [Hermanssonia centrifuga]